MAVVRLADEMRVETVRPGSWTDVSGRSVASRGGLDINMVGMHKIFEVDDRNLTVTV